ncbi:MAG: hypothetical protein RSC43_00070 [Clostridia bacterium]
MNCFYDELNKRNLGYVLNGTPFKPIAPKNAERFANLVVKIVEDNLKVFIDADCDPDGFFAGLNIKRMFDLIGYKNYSVGKHTVKRHTIRKQLMANIINEGYDVIIITDSSTNDMELIEYIVGCNKFCVVIDHHHSNYTFEDYPAGAIIINPQLESVVSTVIYDKLSAGAICALVCDWVLTSKFGLKRNIELYMYGYITLYSDICDMSNEYNIAYVRAFQNLTVFDSDIIRFFWDDKYSHFDRNFVSFNLVPRLNALMRTEEFEILHKLFFEFDSIEDQVELRQQVEDIYQTCKRYVKELVPRCKTEQHSNYTIVYMPDNVEPEARNFTGLVANEFANAFNQTCMCLFPTSKVEYGGSVRDPYSRDMLGVFKSLCYAEGHGPAFGIEIQKKSLDSVKLVLGMLEDIFIKKQEDIIFIPWDSRRDTNDVESEMLAMAQYNEFGGQGLPKALGVITIQKQFKIFVKPKIITVYGGGHVYRCFVNALDVGDTMLVSPTCNGADYQLVVNSVKYN